MPKGLPRITVDLVSWSAAPLLDFVEHRDPTPAMMLMLHEAATEVAMLIARSKLSLEAIKVSFQQLRGESDTLHPGFKVFIRERSGNVIECEVEDCGPVRWDEDIQKAEPSIVEEVKEGIERTIKFHLEEMLKFEKDLASLLDVLRAKPSSKKKQ